jgi:hypothetical protein
MLLAAARALADRADMLCSSIRPGNVPDLLLRRYRLNVWIAAVSGPPHLVRDKIGPIAAFKTIVSVRSPI